jgi:hypothetical protein
MNIQFYINNILADYKELDTLPFLLNVGMRDFLKIGNLEGIELGNVSNVLPLPASKVNKAIFEGKSNNQLSLKVVKNGSEFFNGLCFLKSKTSQRSKVATLNIEISGGNSELIERLSGVSLRSLSMGNVTYSNSSVIATWTGGIGTNDVIYAPCIYGKLNSETLNVWRLEDLRPAIYYETILASIETFLGITIESNLRSSPIFKQSIHLFGAGNKWSNTVAELTNNQTADGAVFGLLYTPTLSENTLFNIEFNVVTGGSALIDHIDLVAGTHTETIAYVPSAGVRQYRLTNELIINGQDIEVRAKTSANADIALPSGSTMNSISLTTPTDGSTVSIASCLQDIEAKDWLKEIFTQFNLIAFYNPIIKLLRLDSAFNHTVSSTTYEGFIKLDLSNVKDLELDNIEITEKYKTDFDKLRFNYKSDKIVELEIDKNIDTKNVAVNGSEVVLSDGDKVKEIKSLYENVFNGTVATVSDIEFPLLFDEDFKIDVVPLVLLSATFETGPKNALVTGETQLFNFEGANYTTGPIVRQNNLRYGTFPYTLTYSDSVTDTGVTCKGLLSMFYSQYFSVLNDLVIYEAKGRIKDILDVSTYTKVGRINTDLSFLSEIKNVGLENNIYDCTYICYRVSNVTDDFITSNNVSFQKQIINI